MHTFGAVAPHDFPELTAPMPQKLTDHADQWRSPAAE
jgi:hypothetical protein